LKLSDIDVEGLTGRSFRIIINNGKEGILQSKLWKELDLTSRDGSRVAIRLEKRSLIKREKVLQEGRWTYKLFALKLPVGTDTIEQAPCLTCPVEHMCSTDAYYSPNSCNLIENWTLISYDTATEPHYRSEESTSQDILPRTQESNIRHDISEAQLVVNESKATSVNYH
jgi:hypothetical protein